METIFKLIPVAIGGSLGAVARHLVNISPLSAVFEKFPFPTFLINVSGSFLIGFLLILLTDRFAVSESVRMAVIVGFLGSFTTFSTFEMEVYGLVTEGERTAVLLYLFFSVVGGFVAVVAGVRLARLLV